jgi:hypothetical protein
VIEKLDEAIDAFPDIKGWERIAVLLVSLSMACIGVAVVLNGVAQLIAAIHHV